MRRIKIYKERTSLITVLIAVIVGVIGIILIYIAANADWLVAHPSWQTPVKDLGSLLFASVTVALLWELFARRAFQDELMSAANIAEDVRAAHLLNITDDFMRGIKWEDLFLKSNNLTIFFSYANHWREYYGKELHKLATRHNTHVQLMLPDPYNKEVMSELARRFEESEDVVKQEVLTTEKEFKRLFNKVRSSKQFSIWYLSFAPIFSYYIFDEVVVLTLYKHRRGRVLTIPAFVFEKDGKLYKFIKEEHDAIIDKSNQLAIRVFPVSS
jgi:hypothetical protein